MALTAPASGLPSLGSSNLHIPKLSYRSSGTLRPESGSGTIKVSAPIDNEDSFARISSEDSLSASENGWKAFNSGDRPRKSESSSPALSSHRSGRSSRSPAPVTKKKSGFLAGLLTVKEPSMVALEQMEAQMKHQRPTNSSSRVNLVGMPGVSSAKLPLNVPRVNTKWDGVPDAIKQRDKELEKERRRSRSFRSVSSSNHSQSIRLNGGELDLARPDSSSTFNSLESSDAYAISDFSVTNDSRASSDRVKRFSRNSARSSSSRSSSGASLPDVSFFTPSDAPPPPAIPEAFRTENRPTDEKSHHLSHDAPIELPAHTASPLPTPTDSSPPTPNSPTHMIPTAELNSFHFPWSDGPPPPVPERSAARSQALVAPALAPLRIQKSEGFLAGEADSLNLSRVDLGKESILSPIIEVRSDDESLQPVQSLETGLDQDAESSRQRLGLCATVKKDLEPPPWDNPMSPPDGRLKSRLSFLSRG